jgi:hypothetical protein
MRSCVEVDATFFQSHEKLKTFVKADRSQTQRHRVLRPRSMARIIKQTASLQAHFGRHNISDADGDGRKFDFET